MPNDPCPTLVAAAMNGFPSAHCRVAAARSDGVDAYVVLDTGPAGQPYLYGVCVRREEDGWVQGTSSNGGGWTCTDAETGLGTATAWGEAPDAADRVRVAYGPAVRESSVENGVYLAAWWRVRDAPLPRVEAFRIRGEWVAVDSRTSTSSESLISVGIQTMITY